jgi:perosamine synthetase
VIRIPIYKPNLSGKERDYVNRCLESSWISSKGEFVDRFERDFEGYTGARHAVSVCNGTVALHLALMALGLGPGDEVIVPTLTYIASVNAIVYSGATPVFVDSLRDTWQIDPADVKKKITPRTKAILCVHLYGHPCDLASLRKIADAHHLFLVEDCAEALGARFEDQHVGSFGEIATYSFYGNKTITTGEGGMVTANDPKTAERARHLKGQGLARNREYWHDVIGYNYRMTNICAAIGVAQLERITNVLTQKRELAGWYKAGLTATVYKLQPEAKNVRHSYWMISILVPNSRDRDPLREFLANKGIETRPLFYPIHTMPMYCKAQESFTVAEDLASCGINLPSFPDLTESEVTYICDALKQFRLS